MAKANKTDLVYFPEMEMWRSLRPINTPVMEPHNEFSEVREPTVTDESDVQVPVKHEFSDIFEREKLYGKSVGKGELNNLVTPLCKLQSHNLFYFHIYYNLFYTDGKAMDKPRVDVNPNSEFI